MKCKEALCSNVLCEFNLEIVPVEAKKVFIKNKGVINRIPVGARLGNNVIVSATVCNKCSLLIEKLK